MLKKLIPLVFLIFATPAFSWSVSKLSRELNSNKKREYTITVTSDNKRSVPIEVYIGKRLVDEQGNDTYEKIDDHNFFIYPPIFVLQPGLSQKIRVRWTGDIDSLENEYAYRIGITEIPTKPKLEESEQDNVQLGLNFIKNFVGSVYITPKKAQAHITTIESHISKQGDDDMLKLTLENKGKKHKLYKQPLCTLSTKDKKMSFTPDIQGQTTILILGEQKRVVNIQLPPDWKEKLGSDKNFHVSFEDASD